VKKRRAPAVTVGWKIVSWTQVTDTAVIIVDRQ
jgi:hypothetical protein